MCHLDFEESPLSLIIILTFLEWMPGKLFQSLNVVSNQSPARVRYHCKSN